MDFVLAELKKTYLKYFCLQMPLTGLPLLSKLLASILRLVGKKIIDVQLWATVLPRPTLGYNECDLDFGFPAYADKQIPVLVFLTSR